MWCLLVIYGPKIVASILKFSTFGFAAAPMCGHLPKPVHLLRGEYEEQQDKGHPNSLEAQQVGVATSQVALPSPGK